MLERQGFTAHRPASLGLGEKFLPMKLLLNLFDEHNSVFRENRKLCSSYTICQTE